MIWPIHIPRQQHLIYWKWCKHTPREGTGCYWQVIEHMEIWSFRWNKIGFLTSCSCVHTNIWMHHMENAKRIQKRLNRNNSKILLAVMNKSRKQLPSKTAAIRPLASCSSLLGKQGQTHKRPFYKDYFKWTWQFSLTSKDLYELCTDT